MGALIGWTCSGGGGGEGGGGEKEDDEENNDGDEEIAPRHVPLPSIADRLTTKKLDVTKRLSRTFSARPYDPPSMPALAAAHRTYGTTQTGSTCNTTPTHPLATVGPMNKSSVTAKPGQSCRIEFTPSEHVRAPVAILQTTGFSLPMTSEGGPKRRSWLPVLKGGRGG